MNTIELHPTSQILNSYELRATELESFINNPYRPSTSQLQKHETMSIGDVVHSYIQHLLVQDEVSEEREEQIYNHHKQRIHAITDRDIDLLAYRDLAYANLPKFKFVEQSYKIRILSKFTEVFFGGTLDGVPEKDLYDLKVSGKNRDKKRRDNAKQKIYYTFLHALTHDDWAVKDFVYAIFTTKESKPRCILHPYTLDPYECGEIFKHDIQQRIDVKEKGIGVQNGNSSHFV